MIDAICKEVILRKQYLSQKSINTIYFGGGTPSLLSSSDLALVFDALSQIYSWDAETEITLECNPDDLTPQKLKELKTAGINRLSIGLQSFNDEELLWMNRTHSAKDSEYCVKAAQDSGFTNITIDLIYGSKFQTPQTWEDTLKKACDLTVRHISAYNLTVESKTALGYSVKHKKEPDTDEEKSAKQFLFLIHFLKEKGFIHYEISNFCAPDFESKHNSNYWKGAHYLGLGPSAHSFNGEERQWNTANNAAYISAIKNNNSFFETEMLSATNRYNEYVLTGLRTMWGCNINYINEVLGDVFASHFKQNIQKLIPEFVCEENNTFTLNQKGKLIADKIASDLFY